MNPDDQSTSEPRIPAISVIMPVHNRGSAIERAVGSVLAQDFTDFELIVVDDGSSDDSADLVEAIDDDRVKCIRLAVNKGGNAARNHGLQAARAPLIAFLDSDDAFLPHKLGYVARVFAERPEMGMLLDSFIKTYGSGRDRPDVECRNPVLESNEKVLEALFTREIWKATPGVTVRRDAAMRAGMFDEELPRGQDFDFILRVAAETRCASTDEILWVKTNSADSISADLRNFASATIAFYDRHPVFYDNPVYRRGFAHDLGRHFMRLLRRGKWRAAWRDAVPFARRLGTARFLGLVSSGSFRFMARQNRLRRLARKDQPAVSARPV